MKHALTVFVVDDSAAVRAILATILMSCGHVVVLAEGVGEALDLLEFQRPDIIFTDYNMPDLKGVELVRWVRARPEFDDVPVFVVSSEETLETRSRMAAAGANGWVAKPVCAATLLSVIEAVAAGLRRPSQHTGFEPALAAAC
ncbi:response regulator [Roseibacterium beibuensis]|uniref:response regulator n=1 Tax=[Roseibacterium] beibuensis TaxID=1193142 RepID=UPI00217E3805|nr:response regulator [Roseibacterium beibuensis]MCS6627098.1 response regulator [Roseibacterium beibuensis]